MRIRITTILATLLGVLTLAGCGAGEPIITLGEHEYDLTSDYHDVVGRMVSNGEVVVDAVTLVNYTKDAVLATETSEMVTLSPDMPQNVVQFSATGKDMWGVSSFRYSFAGERCRFATNFGIDYKTSITDKVPGDAYVYNTKEDRETEYIMVYVDGKALDIADYEESREKFVQKLIANENLPMNERKSYLFGVNSTLESMIVKGILESATEEAVRPEIAFANALSDGYQKLANESVKNMIAIRYSVKADEPCDLRVAIFNTKDVDAPEKAQTYKGNKVLEETETGFPYAFTAEQFDLWMESNALTGTEEQILTEYYRKFDHTKLDRYKDIESYRSLYPAMETTDVYILRPGIKEAVLEKLREIFEKLEWETQNEG